LFFFIAWSVSSTASGLSSIRRIFKVLFNIFNSFRVYKNLLKSVKSKPKGLPAEQLNFGLTRAFTLTGC
jgi:hypothetical protein